MSPCRPCQSGTVFFHCYLAESVSHAVHVFVVAASACTYVSRMGILLYIRNYTTVLDSSNAFIPLPGHESRFYRSTNCVISSKHGENKPTTYLLHRLRTEEADRSRSPCPSEPSQLGGAPEALPRSEAQQDKARLVGVWLGVVGFIHGASQLLYTDIQTTLHIPRLLVMNIPTRQPTPQPTLSRLHQHQLENLRSESNPSATYHISPRSTPCLLPSSPPPPTPSSQNLSSSRDPRTPRADTDTSTISPRLHP